MPPATRLAMRVPASERSEDTSRSLGVSAPARRLPPPARVLSVRPADDERHVEDLLVEAVAVGEVPMVQELLAMVRDQDDHRPVVEAQLAQPPQEEAELAGGG